MTMKIGDELRANTSTAWLNHMADRIDLEMIELPKDADGKPIHVGDTVSVKFGDGEEETVSSITLTGGTAAVTTACRGIKAGFRPSELTHVCPDRWERIADELEEWSEDNRVNGIGEVFSRAGDLADRIRKPAEKEDAR